MWKLAWICGVARVKTFMSYPANSAAAPTRRKIFSCRQSMATDGRKPGGSQTNRAGELSDLMRLSNGATAQARPAGCRRRPCGPQPRCGVCAKRRPPARCASPRRWKAARPTRPGGFRSVRPVAGKGAGRLGRGAVRPVHVEGQAHHQAAHALLTYYIIQPGGIGGEFASFQGFHGGGDRQKPVGQGHADGLFPQIQAQKPRPGESARRSSSITAIRNPFPLPVFLPVRSLVASKAPLF